MTNVRNIKTFDDYPVQFTAGDTAMIDAFGRIRVSDPYTQFDCKQIFDNAPLLFDDGYASGASGISSTYAALRSSTTLATTATSTTARYCRQTFRRFNYQPGKSMLLLLTGNMDRGGVADATGVTRRIGYFDDDNGLFFQYNGSKTLSVVRRTSGSGSVVNNSVAQSSWNIDSLDGTGDSGITLDMTKTQIFVIDFEWLGVGRVRFGFVIDGLIYYCHEFLNANNLALVYMVTPNLPIRYEMDVDGTNVSTAHQLEHICSTVISEGGSQRTGITRAITRADTSFTTQNDANIYPLISVRLQSTKLDSTVYPELLSVVCTTSSTYEVMLIINPTVAGADAVSWTSLSNSTMEYDITRDNTNTLTNGTIIYSVLGGSSQNIFTTPTELENVIAIGAAIDGTRDELVLAVRRLTGTAETFYASMTMRELI